MKTTVVELLDRDVAGRGRGNLGVRQEALREGGAEDPHLHRSQVAEGDGERRRGRRASNGKTETLTASHAIVAVGITGNIENLGLEALGVKTEKGHIVTDGYGKTNVAGLYAIGDVTGAPWLAHKASHEGIICIEAIAGQKPHPMIKERIPGCTYSHPQVASVGLTEAKAKAAGREVRVGRFPFVGNGKAIALGEDQGMVKVVFDAKTGELLGAHMIGAEVTELIQGYAIAMQAEDHRARTDGNRLPAPDAVRDDARSGAGCVRARASRLGGAVGQRRPEDVAAIFAPRHRRRERG